MSHTHKGNISGLGRWIRDEVEFSGTIKKGKRGLAARRVQEWLNLSDFAVAIDDDFGQVTQATVTDFQAANKLPRTGDVDQATWDTLVRPMTDVLLYPAKAGGNLSQEVTSAAQRHLAVHPREVGGQNRGPWVRLYMNGNEGTDWPWCAGFATFLLNQASEISGIAMPIAGSVSCDSLAAQGTMANVFLPGSNSSPNAITPGSLFLCRRT